MGASVLNRLFRNRSPMIKNHLNSSVCLAFAIFLLLGSSGCGGPTGYSDVKGPLQPATLTIKGKSISVEVARDQYSRRNGLMFRKPEELGRDSGMLFGFEQKEIQRFFMKNTKIPLSIAFIDDDGKILQIEDMQPQDLNNTASRDECRWALEMHQGWFTDNGIAEGDAFDDYRAALGTF